MILKHKSCLIAFTMCALTACGGAEKTDAASEVEDFAARINGGNTAGPQANQTPNIAPPREIIAEPANSPSSVANPRTGTCGAEKMGPFMGRVADDATRNAVMAAAAGTSEVRFILPGSDYIRPNSAHPRLNLILDNQDIIRDARCG